MELVPEMSAFAVLAAGFVMGLRHALDADHLAAVSAIVSDRKSFWSSTLVGGMWGIGHTISLFAAGVVVILLKSAEISALEKYEPYLEAVVGVMLVLLGVNVLRKLFMAEKVHAHEHAHDGHSHTHLHIHQQNEESSTHHSFSPRSMAVGMIHGLAGSAGLMLLILPTIKSTFLALGFILIFGVGSIGGMMVMSLLMGLPLHFTASRFELANKCIRVAAGLFSFGLGSFIVYERLVA